MDPTKLLKDLRDGLWHASIELGSSPKDVPGDTYEMPIEQVTAGLREAGFLTEEESDSVVNFLSRFDPVGEEPLKSEVPDPVGTEITRITTELRSARRNHNRDLGGFGDR